MERGKRGVRRPDTQARKVPQVSTESQQLLLTYKDCRLHGKVLAGNKRRSWNIV